MSEYRALSILGMKPGFTVAAASRLNTENSSEFYYWNEFNQMRFTFKYVWNAGMIICHHGFSWCSNQNVLKIYFEYQIQKCNGFEWRAQLARWKHAFSGMESGSFCAGGVNELSAEVVAVNTSVYIPYSESLLNLTEWLPDLQAMFMSFKYFSRYMVQLFENFFFIWA